MPVPEVFVPRQFAFLSMLCLCCLAFIGNVSASVQVVYVFQGNTLLTYNVNSQTRQPKLVSSMPLPGSPEYYALFPSPNDRFLYVVAFNSNSTKSLAVYRTNTAGAPQGPPTQQLSFNYFYGIQFDPKANYAYAVFGFPDGTFNTAYHIRRYLVNSTTGALSNAVSEASYVVSNGAEGTTYCQLSLYGFNAAATALYDAITCSAHDGEIATYNERTVDSTTGTLGPDVKIYSWSNGSGGYEGIQLVGSHMFDFVTPNDYQTNANTLNIYPLIPNTSKPQIQCTSQMLADCGAGPGEASPSGKYLLMWASQSTTELDEVDWTDKKIVSTGQYVPFANARFGPGGRLIYARYYTSSGYEIEISGFDPSTVSVTRGGSISVPSGLDDFYTAVRY
jgi:hypothetical protein